jgi:GNAT superfamily N-acetyltransferase
MSKYQHLIFYLRKYGPITCCWIALGRLWTRIFGQWEWLYVLDLAEGEQAMRKDPGSVSLLSFTTAEQIDPITLTALRQLKSNYALQRFFRKWFTRSAVLWVAKKADHVVGVQWTLEGGLGGFYSVPVLAGEVVIVAVEVFPAFRGQGIFPITASLLVQHLQRAGYTRAYVKVTTRYIPMQRSMAKTPFSKIAKVYTRRCCGKSITVWDVRSVTPHKPIVPEFNEPVRLPQG